MAGHHVPNRVPQHSGELVVGLGDVEHAAVHTDLAARQREGIGRRLLEQLEFPVDPLRAAGGRQRLADLLRSEEHTSELQSLMRISYAVFCLKKKKNTKK